WMAKRLPASVEVSLHEDGSARVACATQDIGTGTYTMLAQMVASVIGLPLDRIKVVLGDTGLPPGPVSGGSMVTGSLVPATLDAARNAVRKLLGAVRECVKSPFPGADPKQLILTDGKVHLMDDPAESGLPFQEILQRARLSHVTGAGRSSS